MTAEMIQTPMVFLAVTEEDADRLFHCVRFARLAMQSLEDADREAEDLRQLERFIGKTES